ncbi:MAG: 4Fe-4S binding protein [Bradyrhizobium sp.]|uniref:4Fe-4S dicluster domain-containing protein n=1 Tax=Bradyrhizobium sp. TaxID=376 RepID=UPI0025C30976|nr:4Fe-4S dicluster domain-containing protein [Bradyrhizobium sp.]MBI5262729.1 4Fe-4S binding protein [Bradyrhizobium sp.]
MARNLDGVDVLRAAVGNERWAAITVLEPDPARPADDGHDASRRHLFRRFLARPAEAIALASSQMEQDPVPLKAVRFARPIASTSRSLLQRLFDAAQAEAPTLPRHPALPFGRIEMVKDGCNACEICARACPTGAMEVAETGVSWSLNFQFSRCVACGLCVEACQPKVLRLAETMSELREPSNAVPLHTLGKQRCTHCDRFFISAEPLELCPICQGDDDDFAAMFG